MVCYRKIIGERTAELEALRTAHSECQEVSRAQQGKLAVLEKAHQQLCMEVLQLRGQVLTQEEVMDLCSSVDVSSSNKRSNPAVTDVSRLQNEINRLEFSLNSLETMLEKGQLNQETAEEIHGFREELEWERQLVASYLEGFQRKEVLHHLL